VTEEHDLPTEKGPEDTAQMKQTRLWFHLDGVAHKIEEAAKELREEATPNAGESKGVKVSDHAHVNINRFTMPRDPVSLITAILLALSLIGNVGMYLSYRHIEQSVDLDRYDDNTFINGRFADLATQVKSDHDLIQAYGLQKALKEK
jgi:hypothetical protein